MARTGDASRFAGDRCDESPAPGQDQDNRRFFSPLSRSSCMKTVARSRCALYARVASYRQAEANTIASQLTALLERIAGDGGHVDAELQFVDDGYSGGTLLRPALE